MPLAESVKSYVVNRLGWKTAHPVLVIESDDWGMVRVASATSRDRLRAKGYPVDSCPFNSFDGAETAADMLALAEVLNEHHDVHGRPAVMTGNMIMANPDFERIRASNYAEYHYSAVAEDLHAKGNEEMLEAYQMAVAKDVFRPQLHGREHVAVNRWLAALRAGNQAFLDAFQEGMTSVHHDRGMSSYRDRLDWLGMAPGDEGFDQLSAAIRDAQRLFHECWGFKSESFMAPCYVWHPDLEALLLETGVKYLQGSRVQRVPRPGQRGAIGRRRHFTGQRNHHGQYYLVRNVDLEPSVIGDTKLCLTRALLQTEAAFRQRTPAIVSSHRLNYIGSLDAANRDRGLHVLDRYLETVVQRWPTVEFMSSDALGRRISS